MEPLQQATAVFVVLALLAVTFYWLRSRGMATTLKGGGGGHKQLQSIERLRSRPNIRCT